MRSRFALYRQSFAVGLALLVAGSCAVTYAQAPMQSNAPPPAAQALPPAQLDNLVAPLALYPDPLLSQVLVACTYPLEIVEAQQWLQKNGGLSGAQLLDAAKQQDWDPSVQALVAFPDVLARLNQDIRWTTDLGNAFLAQQGDVMAAVQRLRGTARSNGKLYSTPQQTVSTENQNGQSAIDIEPADPQVIYVPQYDPMYVWGPPAWGYYPPLYYPAFGFGFGPGLDIGLCFGGWGYGGFGLGFGWGGWGWGPNWFGHSIFVNGAFFNHYGFHGGFGGYGGRGVWAHNPMHRQGVPYSNRQLSQRFQAASRAGMASRAGAGMGRLNAYGQSAGGVRGGGFRGSQYSGASRYGVQGGQGFRGGAAGSSRGFQASPGYQSRQSFQAALVMRRGSAIRRRQLCRRGRPELFRWRRSAGLRRWRWSSELFRWRRWP